MKIIIDTNVLISATIADGKPESTIDFIVASDEKFLACAVVGDADFLITGDRDFEEMQALLPKTIIISVAMFKELVIDAVQS